MVDFDLNWFFFYDSYVCSVIDLINCVYIYDRNMGVVNFEIIRLLLFVMGISIYF